MADTENRQSAAMGFTGWLQLLFIGLKLTGYINWPWVWVLAPIWISISFLVLLIVLAFILFHITKGY